MSKDKLNEISMVSRFIGDFFDGVQKNTANRFLAQARKKGIPSEVIKKLERIKKEKEEIDKIFKNS